MSILYKLTELKRNPLEVEVYDFLKEQNVPLLPYYYATSKEEMEGIAAQIEDEQMRYVCKVMSPSIVHKSDFQAVKLNIEPSELVQTYATLEADFSALDFKGVLVVPMAGPGIELMIGMNTDPTFGVITIFGVGGTLVELIKDVTFAKAPVSLNEALFMIDEIKSQKLLDGPRGLPKTDRLELAQLIVKISDISYRYRDIVKEIDLNPIRVTREGIYPLDARIIFHPETC